MAKAKDLSGMSKDELIAYLEDAQSALAKIRNKGVAAKSEDDFITPDRCHFVAGSLAKSEDGNKNVVTALCMLEMEDGNHDLERDFTPTFRKPSPRAGAVMEALALDKGTTVCGAEMTKATSDLHHSFYCEEHKSDANAKRRESRGAYNTQVKDALTSEIAEARALIDAFEDEDVELELDD